MKRRMNRNRAEWWFVCALVVLCGSLAALQYRWTGEVARAEVTLLRNSLEQRAALMCEAFDAELAKSRTALVPTPDELDRDDRHAVHLAKLREWKSTGPRPIFKRMAIAVPTDGGIDLLEMDPDLERIEPIEWPAGWSALHRNLEEKLLGAPRPHEEDVGTLMAIPVMSGFGRARGEPPELEWIIFELDADYLREAWLPELVAAYLNTPEKPLHDVIVRSKFPPHDVIYSSGPVLSKSRKDALEIDFNSFGTGAGPFRGLPSRPLWVMEVSHPAGLLQSVVASSRKRNLAVAVALNTMILTAGFMLLRATRQSRRMAEDQMRFVANVTHELRTPLTVIRGAAHNLKRGIIRDPGGIERYAKLIIEHAESLGAMVDQVLDFSGNRRGGVGKEPVDLAQALHDAAATIKDDARFSSCATDIHLPANLPPVMGDPDSLRRAFQNIIENAAKHGGADGRIDISAVVRDSRVEILIADQGPGIPADEMEKIFTPFFRGDYARSNQVRGSGLGLSLVKEIAGAHGGEVAVSSKLGKGSTFTVSLPI